LMPSKAPAYRQNRSHSKFLTQLDLPVASLKATLREKWAASEALADIPRSMITRLAEEKYSTADWNLRW
jgi:lipoate-protein ligase A